MSDVLLIRTKVLSKTRKWTDRNNKMNVVIKQRQTSKHATDPEMLDSKDLISHV